MDEKDNSRVDKFIKVVTDSIGAGAGGILGLYLDGPVGAAAGGAVGVLVPNLLQKAGKEFSQRVLGKREEYRIGTTLYYAASRIKERIENGEELRDDDFFTNSDQQRSVSEEIVEGLLLAAQKEYEEKKIRYLGNLIASIAFDKRISNEEAYLYIKIAESLSYRQLCLLTVFVDLHNTNPHRLRENDYRGIGGKFTFDFIALLQEIYDLYNRALLGYANNTMLGLTDVNPSKLKTQGSGIVLVRSMELLTLPIEDLTCIINSLK